MTWLWTGPHSVTSALAKLVEHATAERRDPRAELKLLTYEVRGLPLWKALPNAVAERYAELAEEVGERERVERLRGYDYTEAEVRALIEAHTTGYVPEERIGPLLVFCRDDGSSAVWRQYAPGVDRWRYTDEHPADLEDAVAPQQAGEGPPPPSESEPVGAAHEPSAAAGHDSLAEGLYTEQSSGSAALPAPGPVADELDPGAGPTYVEDEEHRPPPRADMVPDEVLGLWGQLHEGERCRQIREHQGRARRELADVLGVSDRIVRGFEGGHQKLDRQQLMVVSAWLGMPEHALACDEPPVTWEEAA